MAGVDKIIGEILEEAEKAANENRQEAQKKADAILEDAKKECAKAEKETDQKIEAAKKSSEQRAKSSAQLKKRQEILKARQQIISEILDKSYQHIFQMGEQEYFALMEKMLRKFALPKDGEIFQNRSGENAFRFRKSNRGCCRTEWRNSGIIAGSDADRWRIYSGLWRSGRELFPSDDISYTERISGR